MIICSLSHIGMARSNSSFECENICVNFSPKAFTILSVVLGVLLKHMYFITLSVQFENALGGKLDKSELGVAVSRDRLAGF